MKKDRLNKILLSLLVAGVWSLVLRPIVSPEFVVAQPAKTTQEKLVPQYAFSARWYDGKTKGDVVGISADVPEDSSFVNAVDNSDVVTVVRKARNEGWRVHSITPTPDAHYIVLLEK